MRTPLMVLTAGLALAGVARGDEGLPADTLAKLKDATVYIQVEAGRESGSGSGFLIRADGETGYVLTNQHVAVASAGGGPGMPIRPPFGPPPIPRPPFAGPFGGAGPATLTVVFHSGTKREFSAKAEVVGADKDLDLALLRLTGVKDLPAVLDVTAEAKLAETMPVYVFGFPLGDRLATGGRKNPAITVSRAAVSSIRTDAADEVTQVQVDGDLIPGNSGGPLVDAKGRFVGVAMARITNTRIGQAVPAAKVARFLAGRPGEPRLQFGKGDKNAVEVKVELPLIDPFGKVRKANLVYVDADGGPAVKVTEDVSTKWGSKEVALTVKDGKAVGSFTARASDAGDVVLAVQAVTTDEQGKQARSAARTVRHGPNAAPPAPAVVRKPLDDADLTKAIGELGGDQFAVMRAANRLAAAAPDPKRREEVAKALAAVTADEKAHTSARSASARALGVWGDAASVKALESLFENRQFGIRMAALEALGAIGGKEAAEAAAKRMTDLTDGTQASAALQKMGAAAEQPAAKVLADATGRELAAWRARTEACKILKAVGTKASLPALEKAADDENGLVQQAAREAIQAVTERAGKEKK